MRTVPCRDCGQPIGFLRPTNPAAKVIPVDPDSEQTYIGTERGFAGVHPTRLATADRGGFYFYVVVAARLREAGKPVTAVEAWTVHPCAVKELASRRSG